jgi:acetoin utilization protein AcuB
MNAPEQPLGNHPLSLLRPFIMENQHIYEVIKIITNLKLTIIAVLDDKQHYLGCITLKDIVQKISDIAAIQDPGGIIVLELNNNDYSLSGIAHIVESNDATILSSYITSYPNSTKLELTLKINKVDLSRILASFYRFNYTVTASYHQSEFTDDLKNRYDSFMSYLNI